MPPKKDEKKKGGAGKAAAKEVNVADYQRPAVELDAGSVAVSGAEGHVPSGLDALLSGKIANIESLFPEWEVAGEVWSEALSAEAVPDIKFPAHIVVAEYKPLRSYLGLDSDEAAAPADPKKAAAAKKDAKKGAPAGGAEMEEAAADETGRALPRMVLQAGSPESCATTAQDGFVHSTTFCRLWSEEQRARKAELAALQSDAAHLAGAVAPDSPIDDEASVAAAAAARAVQQLEHAHAADFWSSPAGPEIDPHMCAALRLAARFAPPVLSAAAAGPPEALDNTSATGSMQYLWRAIYPKLASGRPIYNPASKYLVRLFLAGKWRKVLVTDTVPLDAEGRPAVATSINPLELWPMILAKAVYSVYTTCGYHRVDAVGGHHFVAFALHVMTAWLPSSAWNVAGTVVDTQRMFNFLAAIKFGGALDITADATPGPVPVATVVSAESVEAESSAAESGGDASPKSPELRTKKFYKDEYRRRALERDALVQRIADRESKIASIDERLRGAFGECFVACCADPDAPGEHLALPILGVDFGVDGTPPSAVRLLVDWATAPAPALPPAAELSPEEAARETILERMKREAPPLPQSTLLQMRWVTVQYLADQGAHVFSLDSMVRTPYKAALGWHWRAPTAAAASDAGKGKDAKGKGKAAAPETTEAEPCVDPGSLPPVLLKLTTASFFVPAAPQMPLEVGLDAEAQAAVDAQTQQLGEFSQTTAAVLQPVSAFLSLSITIHADMPVDSPQIPGDVVVVLQEVRATPEEEPLVLRVELSARTGVPLTRATYHIPSDRVSPSEPMLFWVRLFTRASVYLTFGCSVELVVGEAQSVWQGMGRSVLVREGEAPACGIETEQMLFRVPLLLAPAEEPVEDVALTFLHVPSREIAACCTSMLLGDGPASQTEHAYFMPRLEGVMVPVSSSVPRLLAARVFPPSSDSPGSVGVPSFPWKCVVLSRRPLVEPVAAVQVGPVVSRYSGRYRPNHGLVLFRDVVAVDKNSFPAAIRITTDALTPPRSGVEGEPEVVPEPAAADSTTPGSSTNGLDLREGVCVVLRTFRKSDRKLVGEYRGRGIMQIYNLAIQGFLEDGEEPPAPIPAGAASDPKAKGAPAKKDDKKGGKGGAPAAVEGVEIILECCVDETAMQVPPDWRSRLPYAFDASFASAEDAAPDAETGAAPAPKLHNVTQKPVQFAWQLDVLAGQVNGWRHDTADLKALASLKNGWEDAQEGRAAKAAAALALFQERKRLKAEATEGDEGVNEAVVGLLATALEKEPEEVRVSGAVALCKGTQYREYVDSSAQEVVLLTEEDLEASRRSRVEQQAASEDQARANAAAFVAFNERVRVLTAARISDLLQEARANQAVIGDKWAAREAYRAFANEKNSTLRWCLDRAGAALEKVVAEEDPAAAAAAAKAKGGKKK